jgi:hypothetical protein
MERTPKCTHLSEEGIADKLVVDLNLGYASEGVGRIWDICCPRFWTICAHYNQSLLLRL